MRLLSDCRRLGGGSASRGLDGGRLGLLGLRLLCLDDAVDVIVAQEISADNLLFALAYVNCLEVE